MQKPISCTIISGFLGAGKTTLLQYLLNNCNKKIALIINEFADIGIDAAILKKCSDEKCVANGVIELPNGCICCTLGDDFIPAMEKILSLEKIPEHIIIETSGLAMPQPLVQAFEWPQIKTKVKLDSIITIIDTQAILDGKNATNEKNIDKIRKSYKKIDHEIPLEKLLKDQLQAADIVIMNKSENCNQEQIIQIQQKLNLIAERELRFIKTSYGKCDPQIILGDSHSISSRKKQNLQNINQEEHHHDHEHDHDHSYFATITIEFNQEIDDKEKFINTIQNIINNPSIYRVKGCVWLKDKKFPLVIQAVGKRMQTYFNNYNNLDVKAALVFIGTKEFIDENKIKEQFEQTQNSKIMVS